jgi:predicted transcriptional regulator
VAASQVAHVVNGGNVLDEPVDLAEGIEVRVLDDDLVDDAMSTEERAARDRALARGVAEADAGNLIDADEVLAAFVR